MQNYLNLAMVVLISVVLNTSITKLFFQPQEFAAVDINQIIGDYKKEIINSKDITSEELNKKTQIFVKNLENILNETAKQNNVVILPAQAILTENIKNLTNEINNFLNNGIK